MADILLFPAERRAGAIDHGRAPLAGAASLAADANFDDWEEEDPADRTDLWSVARLAAMPAQTLEILRDKVEVLVARLVPDDGADAVLCAAEAQLLTSVLHDLRVFCSSAGSASEAAALHAPAG